MFLTKKQRHAGVLFAMTPTRWLRSLAVGLAGLLLAPPVASGVSCGIGILDNFPGAACTVGDDILSLQADFLKPNETDQGAPFSQSDVPLIDPEPNLSESGLGIPAISTVRVSASFGTLTSLPQYEPVGSASGDVDIRGGVSNSGLHLLGILLIVFSGLIGGSSLLVAAGFLRPPWQWKRLLKAT